MKERAKEKKKIIIYAYYPNISVCIFLSPKVFLSRMNLHKRAKVMSKWYMNTIFLLMYIILYTLCIPIGNILRINDSCEVVQVDEIEFESVHCCTWAIWISYPLTWSEWRHSLSKTLGYQSIKLYWQTHSQSFYIFHISV